MQKPRQVQSPMRALVACFTSAGVALVLASAFAFLAKHRGFLFDGLDTYIAVLTTTALCAVVTSVTAMVFKRKGKQFTWRTLFIEVLILAWVGVISLSWLQTRQNLRIFTRPVAVPRGLRVHRGRSVLFAGFVHFTGTPEAIAAIIRAKELVEIPGELQDQPDQSGYSERQRTKEAHGWWQPAAMSNPRFFYRHHKSEAVQGWSEGWWVNAMTNEVYAIISG